MKHSHIPPDVVYGRSRQSHASDVYAFGKVIKHINAEKLNIPLLQSIGSLCIESDASNRPSAQDIHTSLSNLITTWHFVSILFSHKLYSNLGDRFYEPDFLQIQYLLNTTLIV